VLKGALLLLAWFGETFRPTRDADLLGFGDINGSALRSIFADVCRADVEDDGMTYVADAIEISSIRAGQAYGGERAIIPAFLGKTRLRFQVDVGAGDVVTPEAAWLTYPTLLDQPAPRLRVYPRSSVIAEKLHAIVTLGSANSRMKDYFDLRALALEDAVTAAEVGRALAATFERRRTALPRDLPAGLTDAFATDPAKQTQWRVFLKRYGLPPADLSDAVHDIRVLFESAMRTLESDRT